MIAPMIAGDQASVVVSVAAEPARAFRVFTEDIDQWWRHGRRFRNARGDHGIVCIEPRLDGRLFEAFDGEHGQQVVEIGRVKVWDPPHRLVFAWRSINFAPAETTEVEVRFEPTASGTRVTVVHRGWSALRADHPARHGLEPVAFVRMMGLWWGDQMTAMRLLIARRASTDAL